jgi:hypothetical protein
MTDTPWVSSPSAVVLVVVPSHQSLLDAIDYLCYLDPRAMKLALSAAPPLMASIPVPLIVEAVGMEAHSLSSQYGLAAGGGLGAQRRGRPSVPFVGDFAAGCRSSVSYAGARGDFATGMRSTHLPMTIGGFATGMRTQPVANLPLADFATGQRTERLHTPSRHGQPAHEAMFRIRHNAVTEGRRASAHVR